MTNHPACRPAAMDVFMLGGHDLEMREIRGLLDQASCAWLDKNLRWGAKASDYAAEIADVLDRGHVPVLVELTPDLPRDLLDRCVLIDHHNAQAGADQPAALEQVARRLGIAPPAFAQHRWWMLVAEVMEPFFGGPGFRNLLVLGQTQYGFFGEGRLVQDLVAVSPPPPDAWSGGLLPESGFWGAERAALEVDDAAFLSARLSTGSAADS